MFGLIERPSPRSIPDSLMAFLFRFHIPLIIWLRVCFTTGCFCVLQSRLRVFRRFLSVCPGHHSNLRVGFLRNLTLKSASFWNLTLKSVFWLCLFLDAVEGPLCCSGTFCVLSSRSMIGAGTFFPSQEPDVSLRPGANFSSKIGSLSSVREDKVWCPVWALSWYLNRTKPFRSHGETALFLTPQSPHHCRASASTISRWIVETISSDKSALTGPGTQGFMTSAASLRLGLFLRVCPLIGFPRVLSGGILSLSLLVPVTLRMSFRTREGSVGRLSGCPPVSPSILFSLVHASCHTR